MAVRTVFCELGAQRLVVPSRKELSQSPSPSRLRTESLTEGLKTKILLQPRICTLRSYGSDEQEVDQVVIRSMKARDQDEPSSFFGSLVEYVDSSRRSHDFEVVSGRLAMIVFASAVSMEIVTGDSLFKKMDLQQIVGAGGVCLGVVASAAFFAQFSSARIRIGHLFTLGCNSFVDTLIDDIFDSLFYEVEQSDWSEDV